MSRISRRQAVTSPFVVVALVLVAMAATAVAVVAQTRKTFDVTGRKYSFRVSGSDSAEIRVPLGAMVTITFTAEDIAHSFTALEQEPHYRINKRAEPGKPVTINFRADKAGKFPFGCTLTIDERCAREMRGWLIVEGQH